MFLSEVTLYTIPGSTVPGESLCKFALSIINAARPPFLIAFLKVCGLTFLTFFLKCVEIKCNGLSKQNLLGFS